MATNNHIIQYFIYAVQYKFTSTISVCELNEANNKGTELDTHANMVFLGMNALNVEITGITCSVKPFLSEPGIAENVPIVDRAIAYDFKLSHQIYI